jgi:hypothetical protein
MLLRDCFGRALSTFQIVLEAALTGGSDKDKFCLEDVPNLKVDRRNVKRGY